MSTNVSSFEFRRVGKDSSQLKRPRVLIVDDSPSVRTMVRSVLNEMGVDVVEACDGVEGLDILLSRKSVTLALCDVNMPRKSGIEMIIDYATKRDPVAPVTKIVMLTADSSLEHVSLAKKYGCIGWLIKPVDNNRIKSILTKLLNLSSQAA